GRPEGAAQGPQVGRPRAEVVVGEYRVRLIVRPDLLDDLRRIPELIGHVEPVGREVAETAAAVTAARGVEARGGEELPAGEEHAARRGVVAVGPPVIAGVARPQAAGADVAQD